MIVLRFAVTNGYKAKSALEIAEDINNFMQNVDLVTLNKLKTAE
jgi:hypothetical protein